MHLLQLPNELLVIILDLLRDDKQSLAALACLSKRIKHLAYLSLYQTMTASGLSTLSMDTTVYNELHPAVYVHNLEVNNFDFPQIFRDSYIIKHLHAAVQNLGRKRSLVIETSFSVIYPSTLLRPGSPRISSTS
ncbi:hypothetical protein BDP27DRAFT_1424016 [Rhodocollybia butyracea]|uniref:F-box domain-containing protein n=1 Tax=Rhodocollybia butyracea TaxID=206335 RepID=A0A9P5PQF2_9AGAR|nr:hypothetical protein BDP27DRAFT_1424016 [Rhodocollybia butyracea]